MELLKIGDLAKRVGLSVRALHHYDAIGLLSPTTRTASGSRLYGLPDLIRLHRIQALKQMGCSLPEIKRALCEPGVDPRQVVQRQIAVLQAQAQRARALSEGLQHLTAQLTTTGQATAADWLNALEMMAIHQQHFSESEMQALRSPKNGVAQALEQQWSTLVLEVRQAMQRGLRAHHPRAQALAWRWVRLVIAKTSNDAGLAIKLKAMQASEPRAQDIVGIAPAMFGWIGQALAHARVALFAKHLPAAYTAEVRRRQLARMPHMDDWPQLVALAREHMVAGLPAHARPVQDLAARWQQLFRDSYCGDDTALEAAVRQAFAHEPDLSLGVGVDAALMRYVRAAIAHAQPTSPLPPPPPSGVLDERKRRRHTSGAARGAPLPQRSDA